MATAVDDDSAAIGWPLVKALEQFGSLGVHSLPQDCPHVIPTPLPGRYQLVAPGCGPPAFDFTRTVYRSRYIVFQARILLDRSGRAHLNSLTGAERGLYKSYGIASPSANGAERIAAGVDAPDGSAFGLPLLAIGHYVQVRDRIVFPGLDFGTTNLGTPKPWSVPYISFGQAMRALATHKFPRLPPAVQYDSTQLLTDVNSDANLMTALICRADGLKPKEVCSRAVVRKILSHVK